MSEPFEKHLDEQSRKRADPYREIHRYFQAVNRRVEIAKGFNADDWREFRTISEEHDRRLGQAKETYLAEYDARIAQARTDLINQAGDKKPTLQHPWFRTDNFDRNRIEARAHDRVHDVHLEELQALDHARNQALAPLYGRAERRRQTLNTWQDDQRQRPSVGLATHTRKRQIGSH